VFDRALQSQVEGAHQRQAAEVLAVAVPAVSEVRNHRNVWIRVSVNEVTERVTEAISEAGADGLRVSTHDNVVALSGTVRSVADRDAAIAAAATARAVLDFEDRTEVA
jgi:osmotically-inducible protein OsmY